MSLGVVARRSGPAVSALIVASAYPCAAFVAIPAASPAMGHMLTRGFHASRGAARPVMMASHNDKRASPRDGSRPFSSGLPQQIGAIGAAVIASATSMPSQAAAAAESVAEVAQAAAPVTAGMDQVSNPHPLLHSVLCVVYSIELNSLDAGDGRDRRVPGQDGH